MLLATAWLIVQQCRLEKGIQRSFSIIVLKQRSHRPAWTTQYVPFWMVLPLRNPTK